MQTRIIADIVGEILNPNDVKTHLKVDFMDDDILIYSLIKTVRQLSEEYCGASFGLKTLVCTVSCEDMKYGPVELPYGPHISIDFVHRIAEDRTETLLDSSDYNFSGIHTFEFSTGKRYRLSTGLLRHTFKVTYKAGYDKPNQSPSVNGPLPEPIKTAMLQAIAELYMNRGNTLSGTIVADLPYNTKYLLSPYRRRVLL